VLSESAELDGNSVYLDGKIYLLAGRSRVLAFDVDDESVTAIDGGERGPLKPWKLMDVSGHLCAALRVLVRRRLRDRFGRRLGLRRRVAPVLHVPLVEDGAPAHVRHEKR